MKKVLLFTALSLMLFGCNSFSDNESNALASDPIIGDWQLTAKAFNGTAVALQPCEKQTIYSFKVEGAKFSGEQHNYSDVSHNCSNDTLIGRWGHLNNNYYIIYNNNTVSVDWTDVTITDSSMTTSVVNGDNVTIYTWKR